MIVHGLTVCVGYAHVLEETIDRWSAGLHSLTVVTTREDHETRRLVQCADPPCRWQIYCTDAFTRDGAEFNKGLAMEEARSVMPWDGWILFFDPDGMPPENWAEIVDRDAHDHEALYGCARSDASYPGMGYFQLFWARKFFKSAPLLGSWRNASGYDNEFAQRFKVRKTLPFTLQHLEKGGNWCGIGNDAAMAEMWAERKRRGDTWEHEQLAAPGADKAV